MKRNFIESFQETDKKGPPKNVPASYQLKLVFRNHEQVESDETLKKVHDENLRALKQKFPEISKEEIEELLEDNDEDLEITSEMLRKSSQQNASNSLSLSLVRQIRKLKISSAPGASDKSTEGDDEQEKKDSIEMEDSLEYSKDDEEAKRFAEYTFENLKMIDEARAKEFLKQTFLSFQDEVIRKQKTQAQKRVIDFSIKKKSKQRNDDKENDYFACNHQSPNSKLKQIEEKGYLVRSCSKLKKMANTHESKRKEQEKIIEKLAQENQRLESQNRALEQQLQESQACNNSLS